jgi:hypothetical protein
MTEPAIMKTDAMAFMTPDVQSVPAAPGHPTVRLGVLHAAQPGRLGWLRGVH